MSYCRSLEELADRGRGVLLQRRIFRAWQRAAREGRTELWTWERRARDHHNRSAATLEPSVAAELITVMFPPCPAPSQEPSVAAELITVMFPTCPAPSQEPEAPHSAGMAEVRTSLTRGEVQGAAEGRPAEEGGVMAARLPAEEAGAGGGGGQQPGCPHLRLQPPLLTTAPLVTRAEVFHVQSPNFTTQAY